jgi:predicted small lipoprotein YifL
MTSRVVNAALAVLLLGGCGQKGPLYLPDETGEVITRPTQTPSPPPAEEPPPPDDDEGDEKKPQR